MNGDKAHPAAAVTLIVTVSLALWYLIFLAGTHIWKAIL